MLCQAVCIAMHTHVTSPTREFLVPIIQWIDRTYITSDGRVSLKPYMFTPAIFKETFRHRIQAWGYHGVLPKSKKSSALQRNLQASDSSMGLSLIFTKIQKVIRTK